MIGKRSISREQDGAGVLVYDLVRWTVMVGFALLCVLPFLNIIAVSLTPSIEYTRNPLIIWPQEPTLDAYRQIMSSSRIFRSVINSVYITVLGTVTSLFLTSTFAYGLSKQGMPGRTVFGTIVIVAMLFGPGIIPLYVVVRGLGLINTYWSVILSLAIQPFYCVLMRNFFENIPKDIMESAYMEGASERRILWSIVLPLSKAAIAVFTLFYSVFFWNEFFRPLMFLNDPDMWPIQVWLREIVINSSDMRMRADDVDNIQMVPEIVKNAVVVVATLPILFVYPFLQKHFAKGLLIGAVKG
jgi:putative aldouronate transport system permease protein